MNEYVVSIGTILSPVVLWITFAVILVVFSIVSWVLAYHWKRYVFHPVRVKRVRGYMKLYFGVSFSLFAGMIISLIAYSL